MEETSKQLGAIQFMVICLWFMMMMHSCASSQREGDIKESIDNIKCTCIEESK